MKVLITALQSPVSLLYLSIISLPVLFTSCFILRAESPFKAGYGLYTMPGWQLNNDKTSLHGVVGYSRFKLSGGGGNSNYMQIGPQFRQSLSKQPESGFWAGGEITYLYSFIKFDDVSIKPHSSGYTVGGIAGYRFKLGTIPASFYAAPAFMHKGGYVTNGVSDNQPNNGFIARIGFDIHFMSLLNKKGR